MQYNQDCTTIRRLSLHGHGRKQVQISSGAFIYEAENGGYVTLSYTVQKLGSHGMYAPRHPKCLRPCMGIFHLLHPHSAVCKAVCVVDSETSVTQSDMKYVHTYKTISYYVLLTV